MSASENMIIERATSLQSLLGDLTPETIDDIAAQIIHSNMINTESGIRQIVSAILVTVNTRPLLIPILSQLVGSLASAASPKNVLGNLEGCILKTIYGMLSDPEPFPSEAGSLAFLYQAFRNDAIVHSIEHFVKRLSREHSDALSICWILCYFAPELEAADPALFANAVDQVRVSATHHTFPRIFQIFVDQFELLRGNNWRVLKGLRNFFEDAETPSIESCLRHDDIEDLQRRSLNPTFSLDTRIASTPYLPSTYLVAQPTLIQVAAFFGARKCFKWLLMNGADLRARDRNFVSLPQMAVAGGDIEIIRLCQGYGLDFYSTPHCAVTFHRNEIFDWLSETTAAAVDDEVDIYGQTTFHCACESNNLYVLSKLVSTCKDVNIVSSFRRWTPLRIAVRSSSLEAIQCLLSFPSVNVNATGPRGLTPLHVAAYHGDIEIAKLLIERGAQTDIVANGRTPLLIAIKQQQSAFAEYLLTVPTVDINVAMPTGVTPLIAAIRCRLDSIAMKLATNPCVNINAFDSEGRTALYWAIKRHKTHVFDALMARRDVNLKVTTSSQFTLLHVAAKRYHMLHALLARGIIDVNALNSDRKTALHRAIKTGNLKGVSLLIEYPGINLNIGTARKGTPLHYALTKATEDIAVKLIASPKTDINCSSTTCPIPLICAIKKNLVHATRALCARTDLKTTPNMFQNLACHPLVLAVEKRNLEFLQILLTETCCDIADNEGAMKTAYTLAVNQKFTEGARALKQYQTQHKARRNSTLAQSSKKRGFFSRYWL
jgi:ankyrin repeat protein